MMNSTQVQALQRQLKDLIANNEAVHAIELLLQSLPFISEKYNSVVQISEQYAKANLEKIRGTLSADQWMYTFARLSDNLLNVIDRLSTHDFEARSDSKKSRLGSVMYAIPPKMEVLKEEMCTIRLAFDQAILLENLLFGTGAQVKSLRRIDERMEVEIVDPNEEKSFTIRTISSATQKVERDDYTEWLFFIKPLKEGKFPLFLKVSIITIEDGERVRKELILQEIIEVLTHLPIKEKPGMEMQQAGFFFFVGMPLLVGVGEETSTSELIEEVTLETATAAIVEQTTRFTLANLLKLAAVISSLVVGIWWFMLKEPTVELIGEGEQQEARAVSVSMKIDPPIVQLLDGFVELVIEEPWKPWTKTLASGTVISGDADAFISNDGWEVIKKPVLLRYREYKTPAELVLSGIPLQVPSEGNDAWLKTAGMFEIWGFDKQTNDSLRIRPTIAAVVNPNTKNPPPSESKTPKIQVSFVADRQAKGFDNWSFSRDGWVLNKQGNDPALREDVSDGQTLPQRNKWTDSDLPVKRKVNIEKIKNINANCCPPLNELDVVPLIYADKADYKKWSETPWKDLVLKQVKGDTTAFIVQAESKSGEKYNFRFLSPSRKGEVQRRFDAEYEQALKKEAAKTKNLNKEEKVLRQQDIFYRTMEVYGFGIHNFDALSLEKTLSLTADFNFGNSFSAEKKSLVRVYLITNAGQTVLCYYPSQWDNFRFNPASNNALIALLPDNQVAYFKASDFRKELEKMKLANGKYIFNMTVKPGSIQSEESLNTIIENIML